MRHFRVPIAKALIVALMLSLSVPIVAPAWADGPRQVNEDQAPDPKELNAGDPDAGIGSGIADPAGDLPAVLRPLILAQIQISSGPFAQPLTALVLRIACLKRAGGRNAQGPLR